LFSFINFQHYYLQKTHACMFFSISLF